MRSPVLVLNALSNLPSSSELGRSGFSHSTRLTVAGGREEHGGQQIATSKQSSQNLGSPSTLRHHDGNAPGYQLCDTHRDPHAQCHRGLQNGRGAARVSRDSVRTAIMRSRQRKGCRRGQREGCSARWASRTIALFLDLF